MGEEMQTTIENFYKNTNPGDLEEIEEIVRDAENTVETGDEPRADFWGKVKTAKLPTREENTGMVRRYQAGDTDVMEEILVRNGRLVIAVARRYVFGGNSWDDALQEGLIGMMRGVSTFDPGRGVAFSTYVVWWIRQAIRRYLYDNSTTIRIPVNMRDKVNKINMENRRRESGALPPMNAKDVMEMFGVDKRTAGFILGISESDTVSISAKVGEGEDAELGDFLEDKHEGPEDSVVRDVTSSAVSDFLREKLTARQFDIISRRWGLDGRPVETLKEIAEDYGCTRERIRQIQEKTEMRIRHLGYKLERETGIGIRGF